MLTVRPFFQTMRGNPKRRFSARTLRAARRNARNAAFVSRLIACGALPLTLFIFVLRLLELYPKYRDSPPLISRCQIRQPSPARHRCYQKSPTHRLKAGNAWSDWKGCAGNVGECRRPEHHDLLSGRVHGHDRLPCWHPATRDRIVSRHSHAALPAAADERKSDRSKWFPDQTSRDGEGILQFAGAAGGQPELLPPPEPGGESPRAISSALKKRRHLTSFGRNSRAKVVLPAPLHPAMR